MGRVPTMDQDIGLGGSFGAAEKGITEAIPRGYIGTTHGKPESREHCSRWLRHPVFLLRYGHGVGTISAFPRGRMISRRHLGGGRGRNGSAPWAATHSEDTLVRDYDPQSAGCAVPRLPRGARWSSPLIGVGCFGLLYLRVSSAHLANCTPLSPSPAAAVVRRFGGAVWRVRLVLIGTNSRSSV